MLSPGRYHEKVPTDPAANLRLRRRVLAACRADPALQAGFREACRLDACLYVSLFGWQYNPNVESGRPKYGPFILWPFQADALREILRCVADRRDLVIEKSREMGASWLCLFAMDWLARFHPGEKFLCISHTADAVERADDPDCLFWKLDFISEHLPVWMTPGGVVRKKMRVVYPGTRSTVTGQASTGRAGIGGRATAAFVDEFSRIGDDRAVLAGTADTTGCRIFNSTHTDVGTAFYDLTRRADVRKLVMHWSQHPQKNPGLYRVEENARVVPLDPRYQFPAGYQFVVDGTPAGGPHPGLRSPWYDFQSGRRGSSRAVAMDLDINPTGAASQFYDPLVVRRVAAACRDPDWAGDLRHSVGDDARPLGLAPDAHGPLLLWLRPGLTAEGALARVPPGRYFVAGDIGTGQGATPSCFTVFDAATGQKVGRYADNTTDPKALAYKAVALCRLFADRAGDPALLAWETPGPGLTFGNTVLKDIGFRHVYWRTDVFFDEERVSDQPGWFANPKSKLHLHAEYRSALAAGDFVNPDRESLESALAFVHAGGSVEHPKARKGDDPAGIGSNHGDLVVADALAWLVAARTAKAAGRPAAAPDDPPPPNSVLGRQLYTRRRDRDRAGLWGQR